MNTNCPCPATSCRRFGNCAECRQFHRKINTSTYCDRIEGAASVDSKGVNLMDYAACAG